MLEDEDEFVLSPELACDELAVEEELEELGEAVEELEGLLVLLEELPGVEPPVSEWC